jgi:hypothetical protein
MSAEPSPRTAPRPPPGPPPGPPSRSWSVPAGPANGVAPAGCGLRAAQALIRIAAAASSIATGTVSVAGVPASLGTIGAVSIAMQTATRLSGATP